MTSLVQRVPGEILFLEGEWRGNWPPERSVLAFGVSRKAEASLGRRFRQNAVVFVRYGKVPELLIHQHGTVYIAVATLTRCLRRKLACVAAGSLGTTTVDVWAGFGT